MKKLFLTGVCLISFLACSIAQVGISNDGSQPDPSAMLDIKSTQQGMLPPRMTTEQRNTIDSPVEGLLIFNITTGCIDYYLGGSWKSLGGASEPMFQCGMKMTDNRDGKLYNTVKIGTQCWMAENLNIGSRINGPVEPSNNQLVEKYCYNDLELSCSVFGGIYKWGELVQYLNGASNNGSWNPAPSGNVKGICPSGWHLPSMDEWNDVINYAGGSIIAGGLMKEKGVAHWAFPNAGSTNSTGFSALPGGMLYNGTFYEANNKAYFWSSTETCTTGSWSFYMSSEYEFAAPANTQKDYGYSVRCVQD